MDLVVLLSVALAGLAGAAVWQARFDKPKVSPWQGLAEACGLTDVRATRWWGGLTGRCGALEVRFEAFDRGQGVRGTRVTIRGISPLVAFKRESLGTRFGRALGEGEITVGDEAFDRKFFVQGRTLILRALLDAETRRLLMDAFVGRIGGSATAGKAASMGLSLFGGEIQAEFNDAPGTGGEPSADTVQYLLALARRLVDPPDLVQRLVDNAQQDPQPAVRSLVLHTLEGEAPEHPATRVAMQHAARSDGDAGVRLQAALWLCDEGRPTLEDLAADGSVKDWISARAITELGGHLAVERARSILGESLAANRYATALAAVSAVERGGDDQVSTLVGVLANLNVGLAVAAAEALGRLASTSAEGPLLQALVRGPDPLRRACADALARAGTASAVLALRELEDGSVGALRKAAREAVAQIQARLTGALPGQLALTQGSEGQLALTDDGRGRVALPDPPGSA